jgi:hypothetical protein
LSIKSSRAFKRVFERVREDDGTSIAGLGVRYADVPGRVSFVSWLARHEVPEARRVAEYFRRYRSNDFHGFGCTPTLLSMQDVAEVFAGDQLAHSVMVGILRQWDFGLYDVKYEKRNVLDPDEVERPRWFTTFVHRRGDKRVAQPFRYESSGTVGLFAQLSRILPVLMHGGVAIVDEIEADLHPQMVEVLIDLFRLPDRNPQNAQLIFTTHSPPLMNCLNKWSVAFVEKTDCDSTAWRLADLKGAQGRDNHAARYLAGAYGAVPRERDIEDESDVPS